MYKNKQKRKCIIDIETTDFFPWNSGRIICIGLKDVESGETNVFHEECEKELVENFVNFFNTKKYREIIGYNIAFDLRFVFSRCLKYEIEAGNLFSAETSDVMKTLKQVNCLDSYNKPGTLGQWSDYVFCDSKLYKNTQIPLLYKIGEIDEIISYNKKDLELTCRLWNSINRVLGKT